jgi:hypothetical protein
MSFLPFMPTSAAIPRSALIAAGAVLVLLLLWMWSHRIRRRYVVIGESESIRMAIIQMGRIANSLERLSFSAEIQKAPEEAKDTGKVALSAFGR